MVEPAALRPLPFLRAWEILGWMVLGLVMLGAGPAQAQQAAGVQHVATGMASARFFAPWGGDAAPAARSDAAQGEAMIAAPRFGPAVAPGDQARAIDCMTTAIAYEAGYEPLAGREAVAQVILNRLREPRFPKTVCGVVFEGSQRRTGCQFTFACDGSLMRPLRTEVVTAARAAAVSVLDGLAPDHVRGATHYHADYVNPYWASTGQVTARIGAHLFYRMPAEAARLAGRPLITRGESGLAADAFPLALVPASHTRGKTRSPSTTPARLFAPWGLALTATGTADRANAQEH